MTADGGCLQTQPMLQPVGLAQAPGHAPPELWPAPCTARVSFPLSARASACPPGAQPSGMLHKSLNKYHWLVQTLPRDGALSILFLSIFSSIITDWAKKSSPTIRAVGCWHPPPAPSSYWEKTACNLASCSARGHFDVLLPTLQLTRCPSAPSSLLCPHPGLAAGRDDSIIGDRWGPSRGQEGRAFSRQQCYKPFHSLSFRPDPMQTPLDLLSGWDGGARGKGQPWHPTCCHLGWEGGIFPTH